jgi:hypothetical protein
MASLNAYMSFKRVTRFPNTTEFIVASTLHSGPEYSLGVDPDSEALLISTTTPAGEPVKLRIDLGRFVNSITAAEAADADRWEPLQESAPGVWGNSILTVQVDKRDDLIHISYHRRDRAPIRDWRIGQRIKTEVAGAEWEGIEIYPAESRVVDTSNEFHIWCMESLPFGFDVGERLTQDQLDGSKFASGAVQRDDPDVDTSEEDPDTLENLTRIRTPSFPAKSEVLLGEINRLQAEVDDLKAENARLHQLSLDWVDREISRLATQQKSLGLDGETISPGET